MTRRTSTERVYQLDIRLTRIEPPIWRRIVVSDQITLAALHHLLQVVMGWEHSHLHQFLVGETRYGEPDPEYDDDMQSDRRGRPRHHPRPKRARVCHADDFCAAWMRLISLPDMWAPAELPLGPPGSYWRPALPP